MTTSLENVRQALPVSPQFGLPIAPFVHVHHRVCEGVVFLLKPAGRVRSLLLQPCCLQMVSIGSCNCSFCSCRLSLATLSPLLFFQTKLCVCVGREGRKGGEERRGGEEGKRGGRGEERREGEEGRRGGEKRRKNGCIAIHKRVLWSMCIYKYIDHNDNCLSNT